MRKFTILGIIAFFVLLSCEKDEDKSAKELLTNSWKMISAVIDKPVDYYGEGEITDIFATWDACDKDDIIVVKSDGTYEANEGATKCNSLDDQIWDTGTWALSQDEKTITMVDSDSYTSTYTLIEVTSKKLVISENDSEGGVSFTITYTYEAQ